VKEEGISGLYQTPDHDIFPERGLDQVVLEDHANSATMEL
jgi:hypothetical protein